MKHTSFKINLLGIVSAIIFFAVNTFAQMPPVKVPNSTAATPPPRVPVPPPAEDNTMWYLMLFVLFAGLAGAIAIWYKKKYAKSADGQEEFDDEWDSESLDADAELEWFRKNTRTKKKSDKRKKKGGKKFPKGLPQTSKVLQKQKAARLEESKKKIQAKNFNKLPVNRIKELRPAKPFEKLPMSNDDGLINAIEQAHDEYEEDAEVRELALKILAKFRNKNSAEAITQMALYDLSAQLRSTAVSVLADFDHESVFEGILLACADPTREVRAAAARSLFRLNFDRSEAWTRIAECNDDFRIVQAARAAIESDLVDKSIDRLVHEDEKYAYEAFALVALLIRAGETKEIFEVIQNSRDKTVKLAMLHVLKVVKDERMLPGVYSYIEQNSLPEDLSNAANEVIKSMEMVPA